MSERVTVYDLMAEASLSTPPSAAERIEPPPPAREGDLVERVEQLTAELEGLRDPHARGLAEELISGVLELHGRGLERILELVAESGDGAEALGRALADDGVVGSLLLIHDLYPVPVEERVREALETVRPYMESHGGDVELVGIVDGIAKLRLQGSCEGCAGSTATLELAVKNALMEAAPDLLGMDVEGVEAPPAPPPATTGPSLPLAPPTAPGMALPMMEPTVPQVPGLSGWLDLEGVADLPEGRTTAAPAGAVALLVANVNGTLLAYHDACAACGSPLHAGRLGGGVLACPSCSARFDLPRAGRGVDDAGLQLAPVPLLRDGPARVRVALAA